MRKFFALFISIFLSFNSHADFQFIPVVGAASGTFKTVSLSNTTANAKYNGLIYGAELLASLKSLFLGLDAKGYNGSDEATISSTLSRVDLGLKLGVFLNKGYDVYAEYIGKQDMKIGNYLGTTSLSGTGYRIGLGFQNPKKIKLNLEGTVYSYKKYTNSAGNSGDLSAIYNSVTDSTFGATVGYVF